MKEVVIIYWSASGNTKKMAEAVAQGASEYGLIIQNTPDADGLVQCSQLGKRLGDSCS